MEAMTIRQIRRAKDVTQQEMADFLGVHVNTYAEWEKNPGNIAISIAMTICEKLGVPFDAIIFLPENPTDL